MTTKISSENIQPSTLNTLGGPKISSIGYFGNDTAADSAGGQTITLNGSGFEIGASVIINITAVGVVSVVSANTITFISPALSTGSYPIYVVNPNGGTAIAVPGIQYSGVPNWSTAAGSLGNLYETTNFANTVTATSDSAITYNLQTGTLPTGASLNSSNGLISGTSTATESPTTYTFTIRASDAEQQDTDRQFSLTINPDVVTWSSPANNATVSANINTALSNVTLSATSAVGYNVTYTANSLPTGLTISGANITGTPTVIANTTTTLTATAATTNRTATRTINWVISVANDTYFNYTTLLLNAETVTPNVWNDDASTNKFAISVVGDTRPMAFSPYETVWSGQFDGSNDYISTPANSAFSFGTSDFTIECFMRTTDNSLAPGGYSRSIMYIGDFDFYLRIPAYHGGTDGALRVPGLSDGSTVSLKDGVWHHVALVRESNIIRLWIDGIYQTVGSGSTYSTNHINVDTNVVGGRANPIGGYFNGNISNVRVVKGTAVYTGTSNFTVPTSPLPAIAGTSLLTCARNRFIDVSTNALAITVNDAPVISNFGPFVETDVTTGSGYFDGTGDFITGTLALGNGNFTEEAWIFKTVTTAGTLTDFRNNNPSASGISIEFTTSNKIQLWAGNGSTPLLESSGTIILNAWTHVAVVRNSEVITIYINGVASGTVSTSQNFSDNAFVIGSNNPRSANFTGFISNLRISNTTAFYTANFTPPTSTLTAITNTSLLTLQYRTGENNSRFVDASGINNIITRNGNVTQGTFSPYSQTGWSYYFDGSSTLTYTGSPISTSQSNFTIEAWVHPTAAPTFAGSVGQVVVDANGTAGGSFWGFGLTSSLNVVFRWWTGSVGPSVTTTNTISLNQWSHIAVSVNSNNITLYINGALQSVTGTSTLTNRGGNTGFVNIGRYATTDAFYGYISNARLVAGTGLYTSSFTPSTTPLTAIANTSILTCQSNRFVDNSTNNIAISVLGSPSVQALSPFGPTDSWSLTTVGGSMYFDGTGDYLTAPRNSLLFPGASTDFTIEAWVYPISFPDNVHNSHQIIGVGEYGTRESTDWAFSVNSSKTVSFYLASTNIARTTTATINLNSWNHIAVCRSGSGSNNLTIYVNGVGQSYTETGSFTYLGSSLLSIGADTNGDEGRMHGYLSGLRMINGRNIYFGGSISIPTTPSTPVAGTTLLLNGTNGGIIDYTSKNNLETVGDARTSTTVVKYGNRSLVFSPGGSSIYLKMPLTSNLQFAAGENFTIECWVYLITNAAGICALWSNYNSFSGGTLSLFAGHNSHSNNLFIIAHNGTFPALSSTTTVNSRIGLWTHIAVVRNSNSIRLYINGTSEGTPISSTVALPGTGSTFWVATTGDSVTGNPNVYIDDFRITKGVARYTANFTPPAAALLTY